MSVSQACPVCGATAPADAAWCSLCLERFDQPERPDPVGPADPADRAGPADRFDPLTAPLETLSQPASPEVTPEPAADAAVAGGGDDVDTMLVLLAAQHRSADPLAGLARRMDDRTTRNLLVAGGTVGLAVLLVAVLAVLSLLG